MTAKTHAPAAHTERSAITFWKGKNLSKGLKFNKKLRKTPKGTHRSIFEWDDENTQCASLKHIFITNKLIIDSVHFDDIKHIRRTVRAIGIVCTATSPKSLSLSSTQQQPGRRGGGGGTDQSFKWEGSTPRSNPLPFYILFLAEKALLLYTYYWQTSLDRCIPFKSCKCTVF